MIKLAKLKKKQKKHTKNAIPQTNKILLKYVLRNEENKTKQKNQHRISILFLFICLS